MAEVEVEVRVVAVIVIVVVFVVVVVDGDAAGGGSLSYASSTWLVFEKATGRHDDDDDDADAVVDEFVVSMVSLLQLIAPQLQLKGLGG